MIDGVPVPYLEDVRTAAQFYYGVPAPVPMILGQIMQESGFDPTAKSGVGAQGLMQFMPATAQWAAKAGGFGMSAPLDPSWSIRAGVWYDRWLYDRVKLYDTVCDRWQFTLSGYNGGERWRMKRQELSKNPGSFKVTGPINPGIANSSQEENEAYALRIVFHHQPKYSKYGPVVCN